MAQKITTLPLHAEHAELARGWRPLSEETREGLPEDIPSRFSRSGNVLKNVNAWDSRLIGSSVRWVDFLEEAMDIGFGNEECARAVTWVDRQFPGELSHCFGPSIRVCEAPSGHTDLFAVESDRLIVFCYGGERDGADWKVRSKDPNLSREMQLRLESYARQGQLPSSVSYRSSDFGDAAEKELFALFSDLTVALASKSDERLASFVRAAPAIGGWAERARVIREASALREHITISEPKDAADDPSGAPARRL